VVEDTDSSNENYLVTETWNYAVAGRSYSLEMAVSVYDNNANHMQLLVVGTDGAVPPEVDPVELGGNLMFATYGVDADRSEIAIYKNFTGYVDPSGGEEGVDYEVWVYDDPCATASGGGSGG